MNTTQPITVTETTVIGVGERIDYTDNGFSNGAVIVAHTGLPLDSYPELINRGVINAVNNTPNSFGTRGVAYWANGGFGLGAGINNSGEIRATSAYGEAIGIIGNDYSPQVINSGVISAEASAGNAMGLWLSWLAGEFGTIADSRTHLLVNSGAITARGSGAVLGLRMSLGAVENSGTILAHGNVNLDPVLAYEISGIGTLGIRLLNTGSIIAENDGTVDAYGVWIRPDAFNAPRDSFIDNRGVITGDFAILEWDRAFVKTEVLNSGTLDGKVDLGGGDDILVNSGRINGETLLGAGADFYNGAQGSSSAAVDGGDGGDILIGGAAADTLKGGAGDDLIVGGAGADVLIGGAGKDIFVLGAGGAGRISDFDAASDLLAVDGGFLTATVSNGATVLTHSGGTIQIDGVSDRTLAQWNALVVKAVVGSGHDDILAGSASSETFIGGAGSDAVSWLSSDRGVTVGLNIAGAQDTGTGLDTLVSIEDLIGSNLADALTGDDGANYLSGEAGNDWLTGGAGNDVLDGGLGDDVIDGGAGFDIVDYSRATAGVTLSVTSHPSAETTVMGVDTLYRMEGVIGSAFNDALWGTNVDGGGGDDVVRNVGYDGLLFGGAGNDQLYGASGIDELHGGVGGDFLQGGAGDDVLYGDDGDDVIYGGLGLDQLFGGAGADLFLYTNLSDSPVFMWPGVPDIIKDFQTGVDKIDLSALVVTSYWITSDVGWYTLHVMTPDGETQVRASLMEDEDLIFARTSTVVQGGTGGETLIGGIGHDTLWGAGGGDLLIGGAGRDELRGEAGTDTLFGEGGHDMLAGGEGDDALMGQSGDDVLFGEAGNDGLHGGVGADTLYGQDGADALYGEAGADLLVGGEGADTLYGQDDADTLYGEADADTLVGGAGDDTLYGQGGADILYGETGYDVLIGGDGGDFLAGQAGIDTLFGEAGDDTLIGGTGNDFLAGQDDADVLFGEDGSDSLLGGAGADRLHGQAGGDSLQGGEGADLLDGGDNVDALFGEAGDDFLLGGAGNDFLAGQLGQDQLGGGAGADNFYFGALGEGTDLLVDFSTAEGDKIIVQASTFGATSGFQLTDGVGFVQGAGAVAVAATATFVYDTTTRALWYDVDGTGASGAHVVAFLTDAATLHASDFLFA